MSESKLRAQSMDFAVSIINLVKILKEKRESIISNQIGRSGTSIGANIHEAQYAQGKKDFIPTIYVGNTNPCLAPSLKVIDFCHATRTEIDIDLYVMKQE